jgi:hypothetical protein
MTMTNQEFNATYEAGDALLGLTALLVVLSAICQVLA